jgi:hypothetical protein
MSVAHYLAKDQCRGWVRDEAQEQGYPDPKAASDGAKQPAMPKEQRNAAHDDGHHDTVE